MEELIIEPLRQNCAWCGKWFELNKNGKTKKYCCDDCKRKARLKREREYQELQRKIFRKEEAEFIEKMKPKKSSVFGDDSLSDILKRAAALNMSYGEYMTYKYANTKEY